VWNKLLEYLTPYFDRSTTRGRNGLICVALYIGLCSMSIAWGMSGGSGPDNELGASVQWIESGDGFSSLSITNQGKDSWTGVRVMMDRRYFHLVEEVRGRQSMALTMRDFEDGYQMLRPAGMFLFERYAERPDLRQSFTTFHPSYVRITSDQGELEVELR